MEIILAFGLGVVLVINIVIVNMALKSNKQINELNKIVDSEIQSSTNINDSIYREIDKINGKIDSRVDKLNDVLTREISETNRKVDFLRKSLGKDYF
jgi:predicted PurR-regulated permease PerM